MSKIESVSKIESCSSEVRNEVWTELNVAHRSVFFFF